MDGPGDSGVRFEVLGPLRAWRGDADVVLGAVQQRVVLAVLLLHANRPMGRQHLIDAVWGSDAPAYAVNLLQKHVSGLRRVLEPGRQAGGASRTLTWRQEGYLLTVEPDRLDLLVFDRAVHAARAARAAGDLARAAEAWHAGLRLWRGSAFEGLDSPLLDTERDRLSERRVTAEEDRVEVDLALGQHFELIAELQQLVVEYPLRERLRGQLMLGLYRCGRLPEALAAYDETRRQLRDELGVDPGQHLQELHQRILSGEPSMHAPTAAEVQPPRVSVTVRPAPAVWNVPARNPRFTGRAGILADLHDRLRSGVDTVVVQALYGLGGVGKTQLAIEYAHRYAADYDMVWWVDAERPVLIPGQLAVLADRLGLPSRGAAAGAVERLLTELTRRSGWLVIFDNAEHPDDIAGYRPAGSGQMLVTSRNPGWGALGGRLEVDVLDRSETAKLLRDWIPQIASDEAEKLAAELGDLPLAAAQAAAYLEQTGTAAADYLRRFRDQRTVLLARGDVLGYQGRVDTAWLLALDRLRVDCPAAVDLLEFAAFLAPEPIPVSLFIDHGELLGQSLRDTDAVTDAVGAAVRYSLIRRNGDSFYVHRLVQAVIRHRLAADRRDAVLARVIALLTAACPAESNDPSGWPVYGQLAPHLLEIGALADEHPEGRQLMLRTVTYLGNRGDTLASRRVSEELHSRWRRDLGEDHPDTLAAAAALAAALTWLGRSEQACALGEDALARSRRILGLDHPVTLRLASRLTAALSWAGRSGEACALGEDSLRRARRVLGLAHPDVLRQAFNLVFALAWQGRGEEARALSQDILQRCRQELGVEHPLTVYCVVGLALAGAWLGDIETIGRLGEDTLQQCRDAIGPDHPTTLGLAAMLAFVLGSRGETQQALVLGDDTLRRSRAALGADHVSTLMASALLAFTLAVMGDPDRARRLAEDTLRRTRSALGPDNPVTLISAAGLTAALTRLGQTVTAHALGDDTLQRSRSTLGPDHPVTLAVVQIMATLTQVQDTDSSHQPIERQ